MNLLGAEALHKSVVRRAAATSLRWNFWVLGLGGLGRHDLRASRHELSFWKFSRTFSLLRSDGLIATAEISGDENTLSCQVGQDCPSTWISRLLRQVMSDVGTPNLPCSRCHLGFRVHPLGEQVKLEDAPVSNSA